MLGTEKGRKRKDVPYYKLAYGDFIEKHKGVGINWGTQTNKVIHKLTYDDINGYLMYNVQCYLQRLYRRIK